jgi:hypothetical protein
MAAIPDGNPLLTSLGRISENAIALHGYAA